MLSRHLTLLLIIVATFTAACAAEPDIQVVDVPVETEEAATTDNTKIKAGDSTSFTEPTETVMPTPTAIAQPTRPPSSDKLLFDFTSREMTGRWYIVNDDVMGGASRSAATIAESEILVFTGTVSLENNGGFASLRSEPTSYAVPGASALRMRVLGDGQVYHLQVRTTNRINGVAYDQAFETKSGEWLEIVLPIEDFRPQRLGSVLSNQPPLDPAAITSLGIMITDKQEGAFSLLVDWISAVPVELSAEMAQPDNYGDIQ